MFPIISLIDKTSLQFSNTLRLCPLPSPDVQHVKKYVHRDVFRAFFNRCRAIACNWHQLAFQVVLLLCQVVLLLCGMMVKCYWCVFGGSHWFISNLVFNRWRRCCSYRDPLGHWSAAVMFEKVYQPGISYHVWQFKSLLLVILNCFLNNFRTQRHHDRKKSLWTWICLKILSLFAVGIKRP